MKDALLCRNPPLPCEIRAGVRGRPGGDGARLLKAAVGARVTLTGDQPLSFSEQPPCCGWELSQMSRINA
jgi:hypothetical protein